MPTPRFPRLLSLALLLGLTRLVSATTSNPYLHPVESDGHLRLELVERTGHAHFWWPRTLLHYHVVFTESPGGSERWRLTDRASQRAIPFQLSDVREAADHTWIGTLSFFSDLPTGASRSFDFHVAEANESAGVPTQRVQVREESGALVLDTGVMQVRVPASHAYSGNEPVPGPILAVADAKGWMGRSSLASPGKPAQRITTEVLERGPLFARVRVAYAFASGASYTVTLTAPLGADFVEVREQAEGFAANDGARFELTWTNVTFTHRRGDEPIGEPHTLYYRGEDPRFAGPGGIERSHEEFYYRLGHSAADNTINVTSADFTDRDHARAVGLAVRDGNRWDDGSYAIWASSDALAIRFRLAGPTLVWTWPLVSGTRDTLLAAYNPETAPRALGDAFAQWQKDDSPMAASNTGVPAAKSYLAFLNSRQGGMSLDVVKEWQLAYPETARKPAPAELPNSGAKPLASLEAYRKALWSDNELLRPEANWLSPVGLRIFSGWVVPGYLRWRDQMSETERRRIEALLLFHAYFASREEISPMRPMLKGHPNFMADWKYPLMAGAFLFPQHPLAEEWADRFEKLIELLGIFYVRPAVPAWDAQGGRWTENIGVYNWAFIEPVMHANALGLRYDGRDRWPSAGLALHSEYLAGIMTPPVKLGREGVPLEVKPDEPLDAAHGFQRIYPPQGAHSTRRPIPAVLEDAAESMRRYRPLLAESLAYATRRPAGQAVNTDGIPLPAHGEPKNAGIAPPLVSAKYTGYGLVMRAAVGTPDEIAVYLQQIDKGPNYRWGFGNEGGCGDIYYYAGGRSYAGHMMEDAGDRRVTDAELTSNTGVYKDSTFRGIGMNELTAPFYGFEAAQFAELLPRRGADAYAWPEYHSRSVMLAGHDYILVFDGVNAASRFAWNTIAGQDAKPAILPLRGEAAYRTTQTSVSLRGERAESERLEPYKAAGDRLTLVSHRSDIAVVPEKGALAAAAHVRTADSDDLIFDQRESTSVKTAEVVFSGRAGLIRHAHNGRTELALFHGTTIGTAQLVVSVDRPGIGLTARFSQPEEIVGEYLAREPGTLTVTLPAGLNPNAKLYLDGAAVVNRREGDRLVAALPTGQHRWQLTNGLPEPMAPEIVRSEATADGAQLWVRRVSGAETYHWEMSDDQGASWTAAGDSAEPEFVLRGVTPPAKRQVRVSARNRDHVSQPSAAYPVYVTGQPPESPAGLRLQLARNQVIASWGEILGAREYVLSRRPAGESTWKEVYRGPETHFTDPASGVIPPFPEPGLAAAAERRTDLRASVAWTVYEYTVRAIDGVGTSEAAPVVNTDPTRWRNWYPPVPLRFKRQSAYWLPPYVRPEEAPPPYYPE